MTEFDKLKAGDFFIPFNDKNEIFMKIIPVLYENSWLGAVNINTGQLCDELMFKNLNVDQVFIKVV